ncbi:hypothetical protein GF327_09705 [Candidatus Woesearchaeota archaeon]|nr:hypothetical protein [Candidatus Woesearchaeota archaeon]
MKKTKILIISKFADEIKRKLQEKDLYDAEVYYFKDQSSAEKEIEDADVLFCHGVSKEFLRKADNLKWIHTPWAGVDDLVDKIPKDVLFTRTIGINDVDIARYVVSYILYFAQKIEKMQTFQEKKIWAFDIEKYNNFEENTVSVFGLGRIGKQIARSLDTLGFRVYGYKKHKTENNYNFIKKIYYKKQELLKISDYAVLSLPLTDETEKFISKKEIEMMKTSSVLINIGRGELIDEQDLIAALKSNKIKAAVLDVFEKEPLPEKNELWNLENVYVTPHIAGLFRFADRVNYFVDNLERFRNTEKLKGLVDLDEKY